MKKTLLTLITLAAFMVSMTGIAPETYQVDIDSSTLVWTGKKVTGEHTGNINLKSGSLDFQNGTLKGGGFVIDMASITCTDLTDEEYNGKLIGHLKSDDFFGVAKHSDANFAITKVKKQKDGTYQIKGDLTIKGITNAIEFPATVTQKDGAVKAVAKIIVDRSKFDIRYGSGSFFEGLGDKMIYDDFELDVTLSAKSI